MFKYTKYLEGFIPFLVFGFFLYISSWNILVEGITGWSLTAAYISSLISMGMLTAGVIAYLMNKNRKNTKELDSN